MSEIQYSFETLGNSSYLVATFAGGQGIINYQMQMLTNNEIKNIIKANKRQKNEDILISYNITSKISLEQVDSKNKITKAGLINIIEGALAALEDIEEYQLVSSGIVFDEEYIYVNPSTYEPSFVYLPCSIEDSGIEPVKKLLLSLIMGSKVEMTTDNFVQTLLDTLNKPALSAKDLKKLCNEFKSVKSSSARQPEKVQPPIPSIPVSVPAQQPVNNGEVQKPAVQPPVMQPIPPVGKGKKQPVKERKQKTENKETNPKKNLFLILQIVFLGILVAVSMSGILNTENGELNVQYLFGIVLVLGAADFILYREMFKNNKDDAEGKKTTDKASKKTAKKSAVSMPGKDIPARPVMPGKETPKIPVKPVANNVPQQQAPVEEQQVQQPVLTPKVQPIPQPAYVATPQAPQFGQMSDFESDDTVVLDEDNTTAHLEFYENGLVTKIKLDQEIVTVGKLSSQCDFAINSNKISKIHAEFIVRGNEYFVKDCNSTNGTYINGSTQRITSNTEYQLFDGYRVTLANVDLTFRC